MVRTDTDNNIPSHLMSSSPWNGNVIFTIIMEEPRRMKQKLNRVMENKENQSKPLQSVWGVCVCMDVCARVCVRCVYMCVCVRCVYMCVCGVCVYHNTFTAFQLLLHGVCPSN